MESPTLTADQVAQYFQLILERPPENDSVVQHYAAMGMTAAEFIRVLLDSDEVAERYRRRFALRDMDRDVGSDHWPAAPGAPRIMLFGAYGNGNLGDMEQAAALAWLLGRLAPAPPSFGATSWERRAPYGFSAGCVLRPDALLRGDPTRRGSGPDRGHDKGHGPPRLVAIGGGGLLGAPHFPLHHDGWARWFAGRGIPWALVGVGGSASALAEPGWRDAYRLLLEGACFAGLRDAATLEPARAINPAATWFPDPVLARGLLQDIDGVALPPAHERPVDVLLIPRYPNSAFDAAANEGALAYRARAAQAGKTVKVATMERVLAPNCCAAWTPPTSRIGTRSCNCAGKRASWFRSGSMA